MTNRKFRLDLVSRYRAQLYGIFTIGIVFFHAYDIDGVDYTFGYSRLEWLSSVMTKGNVGVDAFLFLSGISLYYSWYRKKDLYPYLKKRLARVCIPAFVICGPYWFVRCVLLGQLRGINGFIRRITLTSFWITGDTAVWYISLILPLYLVYPYVHEFFFSDDHPGKTAARTAILMILVYLILLSFSSNSPEVFEMYEIALTRIPVFLLGCGLGRAVQHGKELPGWCAILPVAGAAAFFIGIDVLGFHGMLKRFWYLIGGVSLAYLFALLFSAADRMASQNRLIRWAMRGCAGLGGASLEIYLSHIILNQIYRLTPLYREGNFSRYFVMAVIAIALAWIVSDRLVKPVSEKLLQRKSV